jgi:hypothetical protein
MRKPKSEEGRTHIAEKNRHIFLGKPSGMLGKHHSEEAKARISEARKGHVGAMLGKHHSEETRQKMRRPKPAGFGARRAGKFNSNWRGGVAFLPYGSEFNETLKEQIRSRDNFVCHICGKHQEVKRKFPIHHIDYNKKNNDPSNLVTLCINCHMKTNGRREQWIAYFMQFPLFNPVVGEIMEMII